MNLDGCRVSEGTVEFGTASFFGELGFASLRGGEIDNASERTGLDTVLLVQRLTSALRNLNPMLPLDTVEQVVRTVQRPPHPTLIENNRWLHGLLTDGTRWNTVTSQPARTGADGRGWSTSTIRPTTIFWSCAN